MACECQPCEYCKGKGFLYRSLGGTLTVDHPMCDMAEMHDCDMCDGEGVLWCCDECFEQYRENEDG